MLINECYVWTRREINYEEVGWKSQKKQKKTSYLQENNLGLSLKLGNPWSQIQWLSTIVADIAKGRDAWVDCIIYGI